MKLYTDTTQTSGICLMNKAWNYKISSCFSFILFSLLSFGLCVCFFSSSLSCSFARSFCVQVFYCIIFGCGWSCCECIINVYFTYTVCVCVFFICLIFLRCVRPLLTRTHSLLLPLKWMRCVPIGVNCLHVSHCTKYEHSFFLTLSLIHTDSLSFTRVRSLARLQCKTWTVLCSFLCRVACPFIK